MLGLDHMSGGYDQFLGAGEEANAAYAGGCIGQSFSGFLDYRILSMMPQRIDYTTSGQCECFTVSMGPIYIISYDLS